ncbi:uncharacterized protein SOCEGT47_007200 [Sorangium cellulosum]|uniref:ATPase AAA-type core domain-containing protein n=1 Tax=Sorangium cellulosum TaxID=56 RepID=A0A4P2PUE0_SORCE|nr:AAA family ATPase [Sorangium cellulosum]AUX20254.1 uncharacterized protein SOCEGT47_007200 [Sorangium cellulosum]
MLTRIRFKNYRSHADTAIALQPINLLIGPAGAGKSNVFKALVLLQNSLHRSLEELFPPGIGEFHWVRSRWAGETDPIVFEVEIDEVEGFPGRFQYELSIAESPEGLYVVAETLQRKTGDEGWQWVFQRRKLPRLMGEFGDVKPYDPSLLNKARRGIGVDASAPNVRMARAVARAISSVGYYHLEVSELKSLGSGQPTERIDYYGGRLPDFLAFTRTGAQEDASRPRHWNHASTHERQERCRFCRLNALITEARSTLSALPQKPPQTWPILIALPVETIEAWLLELQAIVSPPRGLARAEARGRARLKEMLYGKPAATRSDVENIALPLIRSATPTQLGQLRERSKSFALFADQVDRSKPILLGPRDCWSPGDSGAVRPPPGS